MKNFKKLLLAAIVLVELTAGAGCDSLNGKTGCAAPPKDAVVLFDGKDYSQWTAKKGGPVKWKIVDCAMEVAPETGDIITKQKFGDCKLHVEFNVPQMAPDVKAWEQRDIPAKPLRGPDT
jgi:hypothetical protein